MRNFRASEEAAVEFFAHRPGVSDESGEGGGEVAEEFGLRAHGFCVGGTEAEPIDCTWSKKTGGVSTFGRRLALLGDLGRTRSERGIAKEKA